MYTTYYTLLYNYVYFLENMGHKGSSGVA